MTVEQHRGSGNFETGLEDFGMEDAVVPRLQIVHKEGEFKDSLSGEQFGKINAIILGLVKQRILWHKDIDEGDMPMCKSPDHKFGFPNVSEDTKKDKRFPWGMSGFDPADYPPDENGIIALPCEGCQLKEWGSHPDGKKPYCAEQYTLPLLYSPNEDDSFVPAILTFQKTGIKPIRSYLTSFARTKNPAYTAITEISLTLQHRGQTDYSVPKLRRVGDTDPDDWREYSISYRSLRNFLTSHPTPRDDEDVEPTPSDNVNRPPATEKAKEQDKAEEPQQQPKEAAEPAPAEDDDDLPF